MVRGGIHCVTYLAQYNSNLRTRMSDDQVTAQFAQTHGWIKGYLTAYNAFVDNGMIDIQGAHSGNEVEAWLAEHCEGNRQSDLDDAMKSFIATLRKEDLQARREADSPARGGDEAPSERAVMVSGSGASNG